MPERPDFAFLSGVGTARCDCGKPNRAIRGELNRYRANDLLVCLAVLNNLPHLRTGKRPAIV